MANVAEVQTFCAQNTVWQRRFVANGFRYAPLNFFLAPNLQYGRFKTLQTVCENSVADASILKTAYSEVAQI